MNFRHQDSAVSRKNKVREQFVQGLKRKKKEREYHVYCSFIFMQIAMQRIAISRFISVQHHREQRLPTRMCIWRGTCSKWSLEKKKPLGKKAQALINDASGYNIPSLARMKACPMTPDTCHHMIRLMLRLMSCQTVLNAAEPLHKIIQ